MTSMTYDISLSGIALWVSNEPVRSDKLIYEIYKCWTGPIFLKKIPITGKPNFPLANSFVFQKCHGAMWTFPLEQNFLHFSTLLCMNKQILNKLYGTQLRVTISIVL